MELVPQCEQFFLYLGYYYAAPVIDSKDYVRCEAPHEWRLMSMLMTECGMSFETGLEMPVARAVALWAANGERLGKFKLAPSNGQFERRLIDSLRQQRQIDQKILADAKAAGMTFQEYVNAGLLNNSLN